MFRKYYFLIAICLGALILRLFLMTVPMSPWWDPAIYVGMGKFLFSGGMIGMWEILRPPLWPTIIGFGWLLGLPPLIFAQILVIAFSLATIILLYVMGEKEKQGLGLASAVMLALGPTYAIFILIPTNDIPSAFLSLVAAHLLLKKKYFWAGFTIGIAFLMRFPHGLFLVPFGLFILIQELITKQSFKEIIIASLKKGMLLGLGFAVLAIPYFILNQVIFSDPLLPLKLGQETIAQSPAVDKWYYIVHIFADTPVLLLSIIGLGSVFYSIIRRKNISPLFLLSILCVIVVGAYINQLSHKELRYTFAFLPFVVLISANGLRVIWTRFKWQYAHLTAIGIVLLIGAVNLGLRADREYYVLLHPERAAYYETIPPQSTTITSSPQIMLGSDALVVGVFQSWKKGIEFIKEKSPEYIAVDSCQVYCTEDSCGEQKREFYTLAQSPSSRIFSGQDDEHCSLEIYKLR